MAGARCGQDTKQNSFQRGERRVVFNDKQGENIDKRLLISSVSVIYPGRGLAAAAPIIHQPRVAHPVS